jgi:hypothetical protein
LVGGSFSFLLQEKDTAVAEKWQEKSASQKAAHCSSQRINSENGKCRKIGIIGEFNSAANNQQVWT